MLDLFFNSSMLCISSEMTLIWSDHWVHVSPTPPRAVQSLKKCKYCLIKDDNSLGGEGTLSAVWTRQKNV